MSEEPENERQLAHRLNVPVSWIRREAKEGRLPALQAGSRFLFSPDAVNRVLVERARQEAAR
jgi:excisionase family DNA binding protein